MINEKKGIRNIKLDKNYIDNILLKLKKYFGQNLYDSINNKIQMLLNQHQQKIEEEKKIGDSQPIYFVDEEKIIRNSQIFIDV